MANRIVNDTSLTSVANAIREKAGTSGTMAFPAGFVSAIGNIPTGGGGSSDGDVIFIDYDGTVVASKTKAEITAMSSDSDLPANPTHTGLTAQGWNWTVAQLKAQLTAMPDQKVYVGQMYITDDGKTRVYIHLSEGRTSPMLGICPNGTVDVDWGDGSEHDTLTGTSLSTVQWTNNHNYAAPGDYVILLTVTNGSMAFYGSSNSNQYSGVLRYSSSGDARNYVYRNSVAKIEVGSGINSIAGHSFRYCFNISSITIPKSVTSIGNSVFSYCYGLLSITIPDSVTSIGTNAFTTCDGLSGIAIPDSVTSIGNYAFSECYSLFSINIPNKVTSIGANAFNNCYSLSGIAIPDSVTSIGNTTFNNCRSISNITIHNKVTSIGSSAFSGCYSLFSITIPDSVTSIGDSAFNNCFNLSSINIPNKVTSIGISVFSNCYSILSITIPDSVTSIGNYAFSGCYSLSNIKIPNKVTSIGNSAFNNCYSLKELHLQSTTPPTLANTNALNNTPADLIIYVPYSSDHSILNDYKTASNWSEYASYMQEEPS